MTSVGARPGSDGSYVRSAMVRAAPPTRLSTSGISHVYSPAAEHNHTLARADLLCCWG